ncbi:hypothetical protein CIPAW_16G116400 [Carya illinoinensis]|uniref:Cytochrome P450 n=1 Tax=Carya illinoinensis TaxID=32201 RepID=A0A8T1N330_CARIL|nr:hypothetical protein CIPAW_16G116400 [Carya illinoinensis]
MDLFFSYLLQLAILCISLLYIFFTIYIKKYTSPKLPPGRRGWPIIGETLEFGKACKNGDVEKFITQRMTKYSPELFRTSLFQENFAVFCGASGNKFLFSTANKYVTPWWPRFIVEALNFPTEMECFKDELTKLRAMVLEFLKPEALQRYVPIMDSMAKEHLEIGWSPYKQVKVLPLTKEYTIAVACRVFIDIEDPERLNRFANLFHQITTGLLSLPIKLPDENGQGMNEKSIACQIAGMLIGSYDTTSSTITSVLRYLVEFPHVYNEVLKEQVEIAKSKGPDELLSWNDIQKMKYTWNVACEAMRLSPPSQGAFREVTTELIYLGVTIPKGWKAYWTVASTHKNPKYFPDPEKFDPSRFEGSGPAPYTFVPFGGGPRMCPGKEYARLEILTFIHNVVTKFKWEKVNPNEKILFNLAPTPQNGFPIHLEPLKKN